MSSKLTRRRLLGGVAGSSTAGVVGYRFLPASLLPDSVLELRTKRRSVPEVDTSLPVAPAALASARDQLQGVIDRAEAAWEAVDDADVDSEHEEFDRSLESSVKPAEKRLSETEGADPTTEALSSVRYGVDRAAWSLAAAKAISDEYDPKALRERSTTLYRDVNDFADAMSYAVADPREGLASLYRTERALHFARMKAYGSDYFSGEPLAKPEYHHREVVKTIRGAITGRRWFGDAKAIYEFHRSNVTDADDATDLEPHLDRTWQRVADRIEHELPDRETAVERYITDDDGARERAMNELFNNGYGATDDAYPPSFGIRSGLLALAAIQHAKALQHALGFRSSVKRLDAAFSDGDVGMALAARTKGAAIRRLRSELADSNTALTRELLARPREEIVIGDWPLGISPTFESEHPYSEAYAMYLLAAENVRHTPVVLDELVP